MRFLVSLVSWAITIVSAQHPPSEGLANEARIYKGHNAEPGQFPYTVGLGILYAGRASWCGGALLSANWVLTAAHCFDGSPQMFYVFLGMTFKHDAKVAYTLGVDKVSFHPNRNPYTGFNDIALIEIPTTAFCDGISPIPLPRMSSTDPISVGSTGIVLGWGNMGNAFSLADRLQWAHATVIANRDCKHVFPFLSKKEFCTTNSDFESPCVGDSGGPLVLDSTGELVGIFDSTHEDSCENGHPVVYTRVWPYLEWIRMLTGISYL